MAIMRKYILLICALCAGLVSCVKENFNGAGADSLVTFKASYETETKTVLNDLTPYWTPSDKIAIYNGANSEFVATVSEPSATATFKGELAGKGTKNFRAVTPYSPDYTFSSLGSAFYGLSIPKEQTAVENTYDPQALVAIAQSDNYNLSFKNLGSLVKFTIISDNVTSVTVRSNSEEVLSGSFEAIYAETPGIRLKEGVDEVTIKGDFKNGSTYYLVTLPVNLERGVTVLLNGSVKSMSVDAPVVLARSGMVNLGYLSLNPGESQLPEADEAEGDVASCRLVVKVNKAITWYDKYIYAWIDNDTRLCGNWPGTKMLWDKEDGNYYVYYHDFPGSLDGKKINYIISGDGQQTKDLSVTLNGVSTTVTVEASDKK